MSAILRSSVVLVAVLVVTGMLYAPVWLYLHGKGTIFETKPKAKILLIAFTMLLVGFYICVGITYFVGTNQVLQVTSEILCSLSYITLVLCCVVFASVENESKPPSWLLAFLFHLVYLNERGR